MPDTDWSAYGACESCGCVPGWPCFRGKRQLKNPHPGRPRTGREPYLSDAELLDVVTGTGAYNPLATEPGPLRREFEEQEAEKERRAAEPEDCTCPDPMVCPECLHEFECPQAEDPWPWCECEHGQTCKGPCRQRAHDPRQHRDPAGLEFPEGPSTYHPPAVGPITPPAPCCDTWHPAGMTCPDPFIAPATVPDQPERAALGAVGAIAMAGSGWQVANGDTDTGAYGVADPAARLYQLEKAVLGAIGADLTTTEETTVAMDPAAEAVDWTARLDNAERLPSNPIGKRNVDAEIPRDVDRDQYDRPKLVRAELQPDGTWLVPSYPPGPESHAGCPIIELEGFTRASTLGNALEDATGLNRWRGGMVVFGMSRRKDLVLAAQAVPGTEDKKLHRRPLYEIADKALEAAEASSAATVGTALHALTEQADQGTLAVDIGEYQPVLDIYLERMTGWKVVRSETFVVSDYFHAAGTFDRLITPLEPMALVDKMTGEIITVIMPGDLVVVDLKTSTIADYFGAKFFAQLAVYVTGQLYDRDPESPTYGARTPLGQRTDFALILHIPQGGDADGEPVADWHWLDMRVGMALAQLACVNLETRKKRFTRTHMRPVLATPLDDQGANRSPVTLTSVPKALPARDPLGDRHLAAVVGSIAAAKSFPAAEADRVDAELIEDHRMPEERRASHAALVGSNLGTDYQAPAGERERRPMPASAEDLTDYALERPKEATVPGPDETAPLPDGWESRAEQDLAREATTEVPKGLGAKLQDAAALHKVEEALIRKIQAAKSVRGPDGLKDLYQRASAAGYWTDRVIAAASARRQELEAAG